MTTHALHRSDRGSHYAREDFRRRLAERGVTCSLNRKGNCWGNAVVTSFFRGSSPAAYERAAEVQRQAA